MCVCVCVCVRVCVCVWLCVIVWVRYLCSECNSVCVVSVIVHVVRLCACVMKEHHRTGELTLMVKRVVNRRR